MDVLSMQIANKIRKRMDTEYGGIYETFVATENQTEVVTTEKFAAVGHTLKVYVDGILAIPDTDYTTTDDHTIHFIDPLKAGDIILITTEVVGIPVFKVTNPPYDDTDILKKINDIITAIDDNGDGSILDTISNIRTQWKNADNDLKNLIDNKAETNAVNIIADAINEAKGDKASLKDKLDEILSAIPAQYDDTGINTEINSIKDDVHAAQESIESIENKSISDFIILDTLTARKYKLNLSGGTLVPVLNQTNMELQTSVPVYTIGVNQEFTVTTVANDDAGKLVRAHFTLPDGINAEYYEVQDGNWYPLTDVFGPESGYPLSDITARFRATFSNAGQYNIEVSFNKIDNDASLGSVTIPVTVNES